MFYVEEKSCWLLDSSTAVLSVPCQLRPAQAAVPTEAGHAAAVLFTQAMVAFCMDSEHPRNMFVTLEG